MLTKDIKPGRYYTARLSQGSTDTVRVERVEERTEEERNYGYTGSKVIASRWMVKGRIEVVFMPRAILKEVTPDEKWFRLTKIMEEGD
jgi:hypothetical protein